MSTTGIQNLYQQNGTIPQDFPFEIFGPHGDETLQTLTLSDRISDTLGKALDNISSPYYDIEGFSLFSLMSFCSHCPPQLLQAVRDFGRNPGAASALLLRNLPHDLVLPPTPTDGRSTLKKETFRSEGCLIGAGSLIGEVFAYGKERRGVLIHNVVPIKGKEDTLSSSGSGIEFSFHTEVGFSPFRPHYVFLYCIRSDHESKALTYFTSARKICWYLDQEVIATLRRAEFLIPAPQSFDYGNDSEQWSGPRPLLFGSSDLPEVCVDLNSAEPLTTAAEHALKMLREVLTMPRVVCSVGLTPGDMLLINNRTAIHGRTVIPVRWDGYDRWLQRVYVRKDFWDGRTHQGAALRVY